MNIPNSRQMTWLNNRFTDVCKRQHFHSRHQLPAKPSIHWNKDLDKETMCGQSQHPWFWKRNEFPGDRVRNAPLMNAEKRAVRVYPGERT